MTAPTCQTCGHEQVAHLISHFVCTGVVSVENGQQSCICHAYVAPAPPVGACDHDWQRQLRDVQTDGQFCTKCRLFVPVQPRPSVVLLDPKPVGRLLDSTESMGSTPRVAGSRETGGARRWTLHVYPNGEALHPGKCGPGGFCRRTDGELLVPAAALADALARECGHHDYQAMAQKLADALAKLKIVEDAYDDGVVTTLVEAVTEGTDLRQKLADALRSNEILREQNTVLLGTRDDALRERDEFVAELQSEICSEFCGRKHTKRCEQLTAFLAANRREKKP